MQGRAATAFCLPFDSPDATLELAGGKGASLARMRLIFRLFFLVSAELLEAVRARATGTARPDLARLARERRDHRAWPGRPRQSGRAERIL